MERRTFLKAGGAVGATVATGGVVGGLSQIGSGEHTINTNPAGRDKWGRQAGEWVFSLCNMCGGQCGIRAHVVNGIVEKIEPNNWNPSNYTNISSDWFDGYTLEAGSKEGSMICPKGNAGIMALYDPDRVKTPLKRTNPDRSVGADPKFQEISWDQAIAEIAGKMKSLRNAGEAHKLLWFAEDASFGHPQQNFAALYGTPNFSLHSNLCDVARKASFKTVMGNDRPLADFIESKYIMLFGWNPTSALKWVHLGRIVPRALEKGAKLVVVDPYMSPTAAKAQEWVSLRPSTDGALALAMANVIIRDKLYDKDFVAKWTTGFDQFADYVKDKTPDWAEKITTVKAARIERLATELATTKPALVDAWSGPGHHSNGVQGGRAIAALNNLIGSWDRPGGMLVPVRNGGKWSQETPDDTAAAGLKQPRFDELTKYPLGHSSGVYAQAFSNLAEGKGPYQPKMAVVVFQNPMKSVPGTPNVAKGLASLETVVVVDTMLSETAMMADYVIPGTNYLERYEIVTPWITWSAMGLRQPVVKPIFGQLAEYEFVTALGRKLGLKNKDGKEYFTIGAVSGQPVDNLTTWYEEEISAEIKGGAPGITLAELRALPGAVWVDTKNGTTYEKHTTPIAQDALATAFYDGDAKADGTLVYDKAKDQGGKVIGVVVGGKVVKGFATPSLRAEFYTKGLADKKDANGKVVNPLPVYEPRDWQPSKDFPLYLINWKEANHTHTRTQNNRWLLDIKPTGPIVVHPDTAAKFGISNDDEIWVESSYGKVKGQVQTSLRMHPEVIGLQHGWGHTALGRSAKGRGTADSALRPTKADPIAGMALHKETCVKIYKA